MLHSPSRWGRHVVGAPTIASLSAVLALGACGLSEERFTEQAPTVSCKLLRRCDPIDFYRDFADLDDCVAATSVGDVGGCTYNEDAAAECRDALGWSCRKVGLDYDEVVDRCTSVWTCDTGYVRPGTGLL